MNVPVAELGHAEVRKRKGKEKAMEQQLVVFELAGENYGLDIAAVEGIIKMQAITKMPQAPAFVEGVTNLRGLVVPVIDLRNRFGLPPQDFTRNTRIVVVYMGSTKVGMVVDGVSQVLHVQDEWVAPPPPMVTTANSSFTSDVKSKSS